MQKNVKSWKPEEESIFKKEEVRISHVQCCRRVKLYEDTELKKKKDTELP